MGMRLHFHAIVAAALLPLLGAAAGAAEPYQCRCRNPSQPCPCERSEAIARKPAHMAARLHRRFRTSQGRLECDPVSWKHDASFDYASLRSG
jgi:hypothetical protein